jgi:hypothetical protein
VKETAAILTVIDEKHADQDTNANRAIRPGREEAAEVLAHEVQYELAETRRIGRGSCSDAPQRPCHDPETLICCFA